MASRNAGDGRYAIQAVCFACRAHIGGHQPGRRPDEGSRSHSGADPRLWRRRGAGRRAGAGRLHLLSARRSRLGLLHEPSYTENGAVYGADALPFLATTPFGFGGSGFVAGGDAKGDGVFLGTVGYGAYFTPRFRGDLTIDFRSSARLKSESTYTYASSAGGTTVNGAGDRQGQHQQCRGPGKSVLGSAAARVLHALCRRRHRLRLLRCHPHLHATIAVASQRQRRKRRHSAARIRASSLAAALMAGVTFAIDQHWLIDVNYRALYLGEVEVVTNVTAACRSTARASRSAAPGSTRRASACATTSGSRLYL